MAAGKSFEFRTFDTFFKPVSSIFPVQADGDFSSETSDLCSDSGNEIEENAKKVARWVESLPSEENWCQAEEDVNPETGTTGDADFGSTTHEIPSRKRATVNKYRRGTPRVSSDSRPHKKTLSPLSRSVSKQSDPVAQVTHQPEPAKEEAPNFSNDELARALDESMARAIRRYKRHETSWATSFPRKFSSSEPPAKRSRS